MPMPPPPGQPLGHQVSEANGERTACSTKEDVPGSEWAAAVAMILVLIAETFRAAVFLAAPPPAEPAVENWVFKGKGKRKRAPVTRGPISNTVVVTKTGDL